MVPKFLANCQGQKPNQHKHNSARARGNYNVTQCYATIIYLDSEIKQHRALRLKIHVIYIVVYRCIYVSKSSILDLAHDLQALYTQYQILLGRIQTLNPMYDVLIFNERCIRNLWENGTKTNQACMTDYIAQYF